MLLCVLFLQQLVSNIFFVNRISLVWVCVRFSESFTVVNCEMKCGKTVLRFFYSKHSLHFNWDVSIGQWTPPELFETTFSETFSPNVMCLIQKCSGLTKKFKWKSVIYFSVWRNNVFRIQFGWMSIAMYAIRLVLLYTKIVVFLHFVFCSSSFLFKFM